MSTVAPAAAGRYGELQPRLIIDTLQRLEQRICERFPGSGLGRVSGELRELGARTDEIVAGLRGPIWPLRIAAGVAAAGLVAAVVWLVSLTLRVSLDVGNISEVLQASDAALNDVIFLSLAVFFLFSLETRVKRRRALRALHHLRSIVHIVDMHQLTKDPQIVLSGGRETASSPARSLTRFELARYLDYCSEMLSLASKLAALHVQYVNDPVVLDAVNDIETLAASLSNKIWQKIMILDRMGPEEATE
jgi:hypothetical protein